MIIDQYSRKIESYCSYVSYVHMYNYIKTTTYLMFF